MWGAREMKNGGADKLHFPPEWLLLWVLRTPVVWDFQLDSVGPECLCPASPAGLFGSSFIFLLGSWSSVANTLLFFPKTVMGRGSL